MISQHPFIPAIINRLFSCTDELRNIMALPPRYGGLGIPVMMDMADREYKFSCKATKHLKEAIKEVEHGTFTLIVLSTTGGMGREANKFFKKLADKLSRKSGQRYSEAMTFIRKRVRFDLLRTTVL